MKVIALKGKANIGKTTTLNIVYQFLLEDGYTQVSGNFRELGNPKMKDFIDILEKDDIKIGIVSMGDYSLKIGSSVRCFLQELDDKGCSVSICASRTDKIGTINAVKRYTNHHFIDKRILSTLSEERILNYNDVKDIISKI